MNAPYRPFPWVPVLLGGVGTLLEITACFVVTVGQDYRRGFWMLLVGSVMGSWSWRTAKARTSA